MYKTHLITRYYVASIFVKGKYYRPLSNLQKSSDWNNFWHKNTLLQNKQNGIVCIPIYRKIFFTIHMWTTLLAGLPSCNAACANVLSLPPARTAHRHRLAHSTRFLLPSVIPRVTITHAAVIPRPSVGTVITGRAVPAATRTHTEQLELRLTGLFFKVDRSKWMSGLNKPSC